MRRFLSASFALGLVAPLMAQEAVPWRASYFPYLLGNPSTGLQVVGHYHVARQAEYEARYPFDGIFTVEGGLGARGSRFATARFRAPGLVGGWRFAADAGAIREGSFGYYGSGPDGSSPSFRPEDFDEDAFFRARRTRYLIRGEVTRRVRGPLQVSLAAGLEHTSFSARDGTLFRTDYFQQPLRGTDATARVTLLVDTRDHEMTTTRGVLLEAGVFGGSGRFESRDLAPGPADEPGPVSSYSGRGYGGVYGHFRGYLSPRDGTVFAARVAARALGHNAPLSARYLIPGWEQDITVLGGAESHRSFIAGRFSGRGMLLASAEVRHNLLDVGDYGAVTLIGFVDAGRALGGDNLDWSLHRWKVGGGGGLGLRVLRFAMLVFNFAGGPDGFRFSMGTGWAF